MSLATRRPVAAGRFYPGEPAALAGEVKRLLPPRTAEVEKRTLAVIGPHAGYRYSGAVAAQTWSRARVPDRVVLLGPNHTGVGPARSIWSTGAWTFPGDCVAVDAELAARLSARANLVTDGLAHAREHSIEVHLPFLRARNRSASIVPICLGRLSLEQCREVGEGIAAAIADTDDEVLVVASTDMSHYVPASEAEALDRLAVDRVLAMDPEGLYRTVRAHGISMCGVIATTVALFAVGRQASAAALVRYGNSGETSGDLESVVGYAGMLVT